MEREISRKIEETERTYRKNRVTLENHLEQLSNERRNFQRYLENISERIDTTLKHYEAVHPEDKRVAYRLLQQASEESSHRTRMAQRKLEERLDENQAVYRKQIREYEEAYRKSRREGETYV